MAELLQQLLRDHVVGNSQLDANYQRVKEACYGWPARMPLGIGDGSNGVRQHIDAAGLEFREAAEQMRCEDPHGRNAVCLGAQDNDGERQRLGFILARQILVHCQEDLKFSRFRDELEQSSVFDASPTRLRNCLDFVAGQLVAETRGYTFIDFCFDSSGLSSLNGCARASAQNPAANSRLRLDVVGLFGLDRRGQQFDGLFQLRVSLGQPVVG